jgi:hypothetical protein
MGLTRWWSHWVPGLRYWFSGSAFIGLLLTAYNVVIGIIGIAPITETILKWSLFFIGAVLTLGVWYSLARDQAEMDRRFEDLPDKLAERVTGEINLKRRYDDMAERAVSAELTVAENGCS